MLMMIQSTLNDIRLDANKSWEEKKRLKHKVKTLAETQKAESEMLQQTNEDPKRCQQRVDRLTKITVKRDEEIQSLQRQVVDVKWAAGKNNLIITGPEEKTGEDPKAAVRSFLTTQMKIDQHIEITKAYCSGTSKPRALTFVLDNPSDKGLIFSNVRNLRGIKNEMGKPYFIDEQLPELFREQKRRHKQILAENRKISISNRPNAVLQKGELTVNNEQYGKKVAVPTARDLIQMSDNELDYVYDIEMEKSARSLFLAIVPRSLFLSSQGSLAYFFSGCA